MPNSGSLKIPFSIWLIIFLNFIIAISALALQLRGTDKVVYVDAAVLLAKYKGMEAAKAELTSKSQLWQANIDTLKSEVEKALRSHEQLPVSASKREKELSEQLLESKRQQYFTYQQTIQEQYKKSDQELSGKILQKVNDYIKRYGEENGYTIILAATHYGNIAYAQKGLDITDEVSQGLNKEYSTK